MTTTLSAVIKVFLLLTMPTLHHVSGNARSDVSENQPRGNQPTEGRPIGAEEAASPVLGDADFHTHLRHHMEPQDYGCKSNLYCQGRLLSFIQRSRVFSDAKTFVDMPSRRSMADILDDFERSFHKDDLRKFGIHDDMEKGAKQESPSTPEEEDELMERIRDFLARNFDPPGTEMRVLLPSDWTQQPAFLQRIDDTDLLLFARAVHEKWRSLVRSFDQTYLCPGCVASSFKLPAPFVIPGGRFREFYYWDSYWILEGLYVSEMCTTARGMVDNMLALVERFGFVPNGSRVYYLNRSQPPLLTMIVQSYLEHCSVDRKAFLTMAFPILQREHAWWVKFRTHSGTGLSFYRPNNHKPRPESYLDDEVGQERSANPDLFFQHIAGGAESGWDFGSRWLRDHSTLGSIRTGDILAVDLNALLYANEMLLSQFASELDKRADSKLHAKHATKRFEQMQRHLWNGSVWLDYDFMAEEQCKQPQSLYLSSLAPLWFGLPLPKDITVDQLVKPFVETLFGYEGGVPISTVVSGQQWDFPNVWAPMQHLLIASLRRLGPQYQPMALQLAQKWINSTYCGYHKHGQIFEKYHAQLIGEPGGGGEYIVQEGFGWSNGVILWCLREFGAMLRAPEECPRYAMDKAFVQARMREKQELDMLVERQDILFGSDQSRTSSPKDARVECMHERQAPSPFTPWPIVAEVSLLVLLVASCAYVAYSLANHFLLHQSTGKKPKRIMR